MNKNENATPELFAIYIKNAQASKANESVTDSSKTGLCITVKVLPILSRRRHESHLKMTGVQFFRLQI